MPENALVGEDQTLVGHAFVKMTQFRRRFRKNRALMLGSFVVGSSGVLLVVRYVLLRTDEIRSISLHEEPWTYLFFGLVAMVGVLFSIQILINQRRRHFGDSQELLHQFIDIVEDAYRNGDRLSILYPSPNPGQWNRVNRGSGMFQRYEAALAKCLGTSRVKVRMCFLDGDAKDEATGLGGFIKTFHDSVVVPGEKLITQSENKTPLGAYQDDAHRFFAGLTQSDRVDIEKIHPEWMKEIVGGQVIILAAGHSLGFLGYTTLEGGAYRFDAVELSASIAFLHNLYDALARIYADPPKAAPVADSVG